MSLLLSLPDLAFALFRVWVPQSTSTVCLQLHGMPVNPRGKSQNTASPSSSCKSLLSRAPPAKLSQPRPVFSPWKPVSFLIPANCPALAKSGIKASRTWLPMWDHTWILYKVLDRAVPETLDTIKLEQKQGQTGRVCRNPRLNQTEMSGTMH